MAAPVILTTQSVPEAVQGRSFEFQPYAQNLPTSWASSPLLSGLTLNPATGMVSGTPTVPGVCVFALRATNADGTSAPVVFTIGVEASAASTGTDIDLEMDLQTGRVTASGAIPPQGAPAADPAAPVCRARLNDQLIINLRVMKHGTTMEVTPSVAKIGLKAEEDGAVLQESTAFVKEGSGENTRIRIYLPLEEEALAAAVGDGTTSEDAAGRTLRVALLALADIKLVYANPDTATIGPASLRKNSDAFLIEVSRHFVA